MEALKEIRSTFVPLPIENIDTDQIIPARFLKATTKEGFGKNLFRDWRYENDDESKPRASFQLNAEAKTKLILLIPRLKAAKELFAQWMQQLNIFLKDRTG